MIQLQEENGSWTDVTDKNTIEQEIMVSTRHKYTASFNTPFMTPPLVNELGYLATSSSCQTSLIVAEMFFKSFLILNAL
jgi:hypothetical protein